MSLLGDGTLLDATLERLYHVAPAESIEVLVPNALAALTRRALRAHPGVRPLLEPQARDTAPAIAWAAARAMGREADALVGIFPADHHVPNAARFGACVRRAARAAVKRDAIVLIGIECTRPDTAYGYLRLDSETGSDGASRVRRFVEKPSSACVRRYLRAGHYLWNAGMLIAPASRLLSEIRTCAPEIWRPLGGVLERAAAGGRVSRSELSRAWRRVPPVSFDRAVLEHSRRVVAVRGTFAWSDLGSWDALAAQLPRVSGNRVRGAAPVVSLDARGNVVWNATGRPWVLLGVEGLVCVETQEAVLICPADRAQELRRVVEDLTRRGRRDLT